MVFEIVVGSRDGKSSNQKEGDACGCASSPVAQPDVDTAGQDGGERWQRGQEVAIEEGRADGHPSEQKRDEGNEHDEHRTLARPSPALMESKQESGKPAAPKQPTAVAIHQGAAGAGPANTSWQPCSVIGPTPASCRTFPLRGMRRSAAARTTKATTDTTRAIPSAGRPKGPWGRAINTRGMSRSPRYATALAPYTIR